MNKLGEALSRLPRGQRRLIVVLVACICLTWLAFCLVVTGAIGP